MDTVQALMRLSTLHNVPDRSMSPFFSNFGLCFDGAAAQVDSLLLHYNRKTRALWSPFIRFSDQGKAQSTFASAVFSDGETGFELCFYNTDAFLVTGENGGSARLFCQSDGALSDCWEAYRAKDTLVLRASSANGDDRDPDPYVPVMCGVRVLRGDLVTDGGKTLLQPDAAGRLAFCVAMGVLDVSVNRILAVLSGAPRDIAGAKAKLRDWAKLCAGKLGEAPQDETVRAPYLTAVSGLLMNLTKAPGALGGYISAFPSRGGYPTHFIWDSAFQNLAYELMSDDVAKDMLLQLAAGMRADGKIPQFLCSTWARPNFAQPALLGWAARRYAEKHTDDLGFAAVMAETLSKNNEWWLTQRMTRHGLIYCPDGLETGQDDSPRFDGGEVLAVDMNSYLLVQMRAAAYFLRRIGKEARADDWERRADALGKRIVALLYDKDRNLFFDADKETAERKSLVSLSAFLPLWADVPLPREKRRAMIESRLLNKDAFFGEVPFPSVAYNEETYDAGGWWRGPTWMPMAWLMLELLEKEGYPRERAAAAKRLFGMLCRDGVLHELFNSQTGEGLGCDEQGWTAAVFLRLCREFA